MSQREFMIILAHTHICTACRTRLLEDPQGVLPGRPLSAEERERLAGLKFEDYLTPEALTRAVGVTVADLEAYRDQGVVRLRHL
ncbi:MAG: hypothetical protein BWY52_01895 [Chloroflexi bacterium ADurb.Bin325]|nr:MAG: hypothetical protein BWY52_01895 [Chloroflexi bacterium ADurb.Bin325]